MTTHILYFSTRVLSTSAEAGIVRFHAHTFVPAPTRRTAESLGVTPIAPSHNPTETAAQKPTKVLDTPGVRHTPPESGYACLTIMDSITFAALSHWSVAVSRLTRISFVLISRIGSRQSSNRVAMARSKRSSASFSML